ncbi:stemmadenine O-acetyltransferase-like [Tripterygium wilfordii]|uniref:stemmadenine O-acetyltransferase-like n=1 Tax=Tripterygium wilfordii TaxID=458696 RepID=UPI0018F810C3|nr:stemmadenine O-acetyltransferase-like [Tripterygium wilfordii]
MWDMSLDSSPNASNLNSAEACCPSIRSHACHVELVRHYCKGRLWKEDAVWRLASVRRLLYKENLETLTFSRLDQFVPPIYLPLIFFYPYEDDSNGNNHLVVAKERSLLLKASLSNVLTRYHPFAGRIKDHISVECNGEGVLFVEARVNCNLLDVLQHPDTEQLEKFIPSEPQLENVATGNLILVQVNFFQCGGMAICVCFSHKLGDATTIATFIKDWASMTVDNGGGEVLVHPEFIAASLFPPVDEMFPPNNQVPQRNSVRKRLVFNESNIAALKALASSATNEQPTRVEAVTALIWNCAMRTSRSILGPSRPSLCLHAVNLRKRYSPPLSEHAIGNLVGIIVAEIGETNEIGLQNLASQLRREKQEFKVTGDAEKMFMVEIVARFGQTKDVDIFSFSSWCRMPLYEGDFGWGKPIWVAPIQTIVPHVVVLLDTRDGDGIEAWVYLAQEEMAIFECDQELLSFASMNPSVLSN